jgi:hypothetical protein
MTINNNNDCNIINTSEMQYLPLDESENNTNLIPLFYIPFKIFFTMCFIFLKTSLKKNSKQLFTSSHTYHTHLMKHQRKRKRDNINIILHEHTTCWITSNHKQWEILYKFTLNFEMYTNIVQSLNDINAFL